MLVFLETKVEIKGSDRHDRSEGDIARRHETPDIDKQAEYYTNVLELTLVAKERDAIYLNRLWRNEAL